MYFENYKVDLSHWDHWKKWTEDITERNAFLGLDFVRDTFGPVDIYTGVTPGNTVAKKLYESVGFESTGLVELGMEEMKLGF